MNAAPSARFSGLDDISYSSSGREMSRGLDLRKMIRLDQVEDLLQGLIDRVEAQDQTIQTLQRLCEGLLSKHAANEALSTLEASIKNVSARLDLVQAAATARIGGGAQEISAGELALLNSIHIQQLRDAVGDYARREEVASHVEQIAAQCAADLQALREYAAPMTLVSRLERTQEGANLRLGGVESLLACKVDRSEVSQLESLQSRLGMYDSFKDATLAQLSRHEQSLEDLSARVATNTVHLEAADKAQDTVRAELLKLTPRADTRALARELEAISKSLHQFSTKAALQDAERRIATSEARLAADAAALELLGNRTDDAFKQLQGKAGVQDVRACVLRSHYDQAVTALGLDIDSKAPSTDLDGVEARVRGLEFRLETESTKLAVAMRFVEWFTSRGENYEHNLRLVDKHLGNLANASRPAARSPFQGQLRFTPVMAATSMGASSTADAYVGSACGPSGRALLDKGSG